MKAKLLLLMPVILLLTALRCLAQDANDIKPSAKDIIPFGKKLPPPDVIKTQDKSLIQAASTNLNNGLTPGIHKSDINAMKNSLNTWKQQLMEERKENVSNYQVNSANTTQSPASSLGLDFHLTKDINSLAESNARNFTDHFKNRN